MTAFTITTTKLTNALSRGVKLPGTIFFMVPSGSGSISHASMFMNGKTLTISIHNGSCFVTVNAPLSSVSVGNIGITISGAMSVVHASGTTFVPVNVFVNTLTNTITITKGGVLIGSVTFSNASLALGVKP